MQDRLQNDERTSLSHSYGDAVIDGARCLKVGGWCTNKKPSCR